MKLRVTETPSNLVYGGLLLFRFNEVAEDKRAKSKARNRGDEDGQVDESCESYSVTASCRSYSPAPMVYKLVWSTL